MCLIVCESACLLLCVCVCEREREEERKRAKKRSFDPSSSDKSKARLTFDKKGETSRKEKMESNPGRCCHN